MVTDGENPEKPDSKTPFEILKEKIASAKDGDVIELEKGDYVFTETIPLKGKTVTLTGKSEVTFTCDSKLKGEFINVEPDGGLIFKTIAFDNKNLDRYKYDNKGGIFIVSSGRLVIDGASFRNGASHDGISIAPIFCTKESSLLEFKSGIFEDNDLSGANSGYGAGAIYLDNGSHIIMTGGTIRNNQASNYSYQGNIFWSSSPGAGAIYVSPGATFEMNGSEISGNKGYGTIIVGSANPYDYNRRTEDETKLKVSPLAKAAFKKGLISGNQVVAGGGICGYGNVDVSLPAGNSVIMEKTLNSRLRISRQVHPNPTF